MNGITSRFVMMVATAAVAPLVVYGALSFDRLREATENSVQGGHLRVAEQVAAQLRLYIDNNARVLRALGQELAVTGLSPSQQERILRNHVLEFPEFRELTLFDGSGRPVVTSRLASPSTAADAGPGRALAGVQVAPIFVDEDLLPATDLTVRLWWGDTEGALVGRLSLEELWRLVDSIRVGREGYALVFSREDQLVAHGNPDRKRLVAAPPSHDRPLAAAQLLARLHDGNRTAVGQYRAEDGRELVAAAARVPDLEWAVVVEQPASEAFAIITVMQRQLQAAIALVLLGTVMIGWIWSRSFISRLLALTTATRALAEGRMDARVPAAGTDEISQLGDAFNTMADRLVQLQEDVRKQERQALFGRIAAGLVHDLSHPIQNLGNACKLIVRLHGDAEYREVFRRTVDRELVTMARVLEGLRNIARPVPLERFPVDVNRSVSEAVESMQPQAAAAGVTLRQELAPEPPFIEGDVFALGRVYRNLILNAIQATAEGGTVTVTTEARGDTVRIQVRDTGCGIPADRLAVIFEDFVTTKRRGLGLGLAISRKIVEQLGGRIAVTSEPGVGSTFAMEFARTRARPMLVAG